MRDGFVSVAAITPEVKVADVEFNVKSCIKSIKAAVKNRGAKVVVLPELCLTAYTCADWQAMNENYNKLAITQRSGAASLIFINAVECAPDKQYRFGLSQNLLGYAGIERDVLIVGRAGQAEIWNAAEYEAFEAENLSPEKLLASLEAIGL